MESDKSTLIKKNDISESNKNKELFSIDAPTFSELHAWLFSSYKTF